MDERVLKWWVSDYWFLDNSYQTPIVFQHITYPSVTHAMMAAQTEKLEMRVRVSQAPLFALPHLAAEIGDPYEGFQDTKTMRELLESKFGWKEGINILTPYQSDLAQKLIVTGNKALVYGNHSCSMFWGDCDCPKHYNERGKNVLGGLLMGVRERLTQYVTRNVDLHQTCVCEKPSEAFFMYNLNAKLWLKPFCSECQAKVGVMIAQGSEGGVRRFEKAWAKDPKPVNSIVNSIIVPQQHLRPEIFGVGRQGNFDEERWAHGWAMRGFPTQSKQEEKKEPKLPQNITFYLSGRIS